jgi:predicted Zn-dependent protease
VSRPETESLQQSRSGEQAASDEASALIEIGWIVAGKLDAVDRQAVEMARDRVEEFLQTRLPSFEWRLPLEVREELAEGMIQEPVSLLDAGVVERNIRHWDFTVVVTNADLVSYYKTDAIAAVSRSLEGTVISTRRIDPRSQSSKVSDSERIERLARRIQTLVLHAFGHYSGLAHSDEAENLMFDFRTIEDLDRADDFDGGQLEQFQTDLREVADLRLEETASSQRSSSLTFYLRAAWINRHDIGEALWEARPWQFPYRFSRLTTAALSAMLVLIVTAEAWDLGMTQGSLFVLLLSLGVILFTTLYSLTRQKLFVRREHRRLSEQNVVTNVSTFSIVFAGMTTTYGLLFLLTLLGSLTLFSSRLADNWTTAFEGVPTFGHYLTLSAFVASLGLFIGSLGASFEKHTYFRHVTFVDEEL